MAQTESGARAIAPTPNGPVAGLVEDGLFVFKGVRYAAPPVGRLRFRPPARPAPWTEPPRSFTSTRHPRDASSSAYAPYASGVRHGLAIVLGN